GRIYVTEHLNHRVMVFNEAASLGNGAEASNVLGQTNFTTGTPNTVGLSGATLNYPFKVFYDSTSDVLWVADTYNHRVLMYGTPVDTIAPSVLLSVRADANPTNATDVNFTVTFSESVNGVDASDFALT